MRGEAAASCHHRRLQRASSRVRPARRDTVRGPAVASCTACRRAGMRGTAYGRCLSAGALPRRGGGCCRVVMVHHMRRRSSFYQAASEETRRNGREYRARVGRARSSICCLWLQQLLAAAGNNKRIEAKYANVACVIIGSRERERRKYRRNARATARRGSVARHQPEISRSTGMRRGQSW